MSTHHSRSLGQFFTPPTVVDFALQALQWLDEGFRQSTRRLIDPACGEGEFVMRAVEAGLVHPLNAYGLDRDAGLVEAWRDRGVLGGPWLRVADGLLADEVCDEPIADGSFDWVVGNPPYAGTGLKDASADVLQQVGERYDLWRRRFDHQEITWDKLRKVPIEILFIERFWQLCREGGRIAVILPEGVFSNARWRFVRDWLLESSTVDAVIGLPRNTFRAGKITAKTCLLIATKEPAPAGHETLLAEVEGIGRGGGQNELPALLAAWQAGDAPTTSDRPWESVKRW